MKTTDIENRFTYHPPRDDQSYSTLSFYGKALAIIIEDHCPDSREKSLAMTKIEEAVMWANASIARDTAKHEGHGHKET